MLKRCVRLITGQTALEYMMLLAVVAAIVLVGFKVYLPKSRGASERFYNNVGNAILGRPPTVTKTGT